MHCAFYLLQRPSHSTGIHTSRFFFSDCLSVSGEDATILSAVIASGLITQKYLQRPHHHPDPKNPSKAKELNHVQGQCSARGKKNPTEQKPCHVWCRWKNHSLYPLDTSQNNIRNFSLLLTNRIKTRYMEFENVFKHLRFLWQFVHQDRSETIL